LAQLTVFVHMCVFAGGQIFCACAANVV